MKKVSLITADSVQVKSKQSTTMSPKMNPDLPGSGGNLLIEVPDRSVAKTAFSSGEPEGLISFAQKLVPLIIPSLIELLSSENLQKQQFPNKISFPTPKSPQSSVQPIVPVNHFDFNAELTPSSMDSNGITQEIKKDVINLGTKSFGVIQGNTFRGLQNPLFPPKNYPSRKFEKQNINNVYPHLRRPINIIRLKNSSRTDGIHAPIIWILESTTLPSLSVKDVVGLKFNASSTESSKEEPSTYFSTVKQSILGKRRRNPFEKVKKRRKLQERLISENMTLEIKETVQKPFQKTVTAEFKKKAVDTTTTSTPALIKAKQFPQFIINYNYSSEEAKDVKKSFPKEALESLPLLKNIPDLDKLVDGLDLSLLKTHEGFSLIKRQFLHRLLQHIKANS